MITIDKHAMFCPGRVCREFLETEVVRAFVAYKGAGAVKSMLATLANKPSPVSQLPTRFGQRVHYARKKKVANGIRKKGANTEGEIDTDTSDDTDPLQQHGGGARQHRKVRRRPGDRGSASQFDAGLEEAGIVLHQYLSQSS